MTRKKVEDSPGIDLDKPVSRQMETDLYGYYGWAPYWTAGYWPGAAVVPPAGAAPPEIDPTRRPDGPTGDRKSVVWGKGVTERIENGGRPNREKTNTHIAYYIMLVSQITQTELKRV